MKLLVIEDDKTTGDYLKKGLSEHGFVVDVSTDGREGLVMALSSSYSLIILDRMLPNMDGLTVLQTIRTSGSVTPVLILSALDSVDEKVRGLRQGGDDYLTKPFAFDELLVRIELLIRRCDPAAAGTTAVETELEVGNLKMNIMSHKVRRGDRYIELQPKEFQLLRYLMSHKGKVVSRTLLFENVWDYHFDPQTNVIDVHIAKLRKKIEAAGEPPLIQTVRGAGYVIGP